jgi:hypothetical protein
MKIDPDQSASEDIADRGGSRKALAGCLDPKENASAGTTRTILLQVTGQRLPHLRQQRQPIFPRTLSPDQNLAPFPMDVLQAQPGNFPAAQTQASQQQQNGVITPTGRSVLVAAVQELLNLFRFEKLREFWARPMGHGGHGGRQVDRDLARLHQEPQKTAEGCGHQLRPPGAPRRAFVQNESRDIDPSQFGQRDSTRTESRFQKALGRRQVVGDRG